MASPMSGVKTVHLVNEVDGSRLIYYGGSFITVEESLERQYRPAMRAIPAGSFMMGSIEGGSDEQPVHRVSVPGFEMAQTEVTQAQWQAVMGGNPSNFKGCDNCPVENVSWHEIQDYLRKLNARIGKQYRLPSEAEWEYACHAGGQHTYCGSNQLGVVAWFGGNSGSKTHPVGLKQANAFGLYDMSGNVWEWVADCRNGNYIGAPRDGRAWESGECGSRVLRGASWINQPAEARADYRFRNTPGQRFDIYGFRIVRTLL
jgi:formylglycine-generating enzyme required for sulfatase activity